MYKRTIKPICDRLVAFFLLLLTTPLTLLLGLLLLVFQKGQVFFTQQRPGRNEVLFTLVKFKTMKVSSQNLTG